MTSRQHQDWINRGRPDSGLALPLAILAIVLGKAGYTVYTFPNDAHLDAEPPEDHTYYSETGWPGTSPKWWRHAIDIMPPPDGSGLPSLQAIGQNLFNARQAGLITWLKYMNWPSDGNLSRAVQDRWEPDHRRSTSSDAGHIHLSSITGVETLNASFNPLLTYQPAQGGDVNLSDIVPNSKSAATAGDRNVGQVLGDLENLRSALMGELTPKAGTPLAALLALPKVVEDLAAQVATLKAASGGLPTGDVPVTGTLHLGG